MLSTDDKLALLEENFFALKSEFDMLKIAQMDNMEYKHLAKHGPEIIQHARKIGEVSNTLNATFDLLRELRTKIKMTTDKVLTMAELKANIGDVEYYVSKLQAIMELLEDCKIINVEEDSDDEVAF